MWTGRSDRRTGTHLVRSRATSRHRGQGILTLLGLMGIVVVVGFTIMSMRGQREVEQDVRTEQRKVETDTRSLEDISHVLDTLVSESVELAILEVAGRGGFSPSNVPQPNFFGVPYLYHLGSIINVPTRNAVEQMLFTEIRHILGERLVELEKDYPEYTIGRPKVEASAEKDAVQVKVSLAIDLGEKSYPLSLDHVTHTRLFRMVDLAREFLEHYHQRRANDRGVESYLLNALVHDPRVPAPPKGFGEVLPENEPAVVSYDNLREPIVRNVYLAAFLVSMDIKRHFRDRERGADPIATGFAFSTRAATQAVNFSLEPDKNGVVFRPMRNPSTALYLSTYNVTYWITFPLEVRITDTLPAYALKGYDMIGQPPEFRFYMMIGLNSSNPLATAPAQYPQDVSEVCAGSCSLRLDVPEDMSVASARLVDMGCALDTSPGARNQDIPCGVHRIEVRPLHPSLADFSEEVLLTQAEERTVEVSFAKKVTYSGRVYSTQHKLCPDDSVKEVGTTDLFHVTGNPPRYITVVLFPLREGGRPLKRVVDHTGKFEIRDVEPGRYLVYLYPSRDEEDGRPGWRVRPHGSVVDLTEDTSTEFDMASMSYLTDSRGQLVNADETGECP